MVSGVNLQPGGHGADLMTCRVIRPVYGFRSLVPGYSHIRSCPGTAQGQDMVCRVAQVKDSSLRRQRGRATTQTESQYLREELCMYANHDESEHKDFIHNNTNHFLKKNKTMAVGVETGAGLWA